MNREYAARVQAWTKELRSGSTRTWTEAAADPLPIDIAESVVPANAAQLEVVRRLPRGLPDFGRLVDRVLRESGAGRGAVDIPLPDPAAPVFGSPAVAPEALPADELLRVCLAVLPILLRDTSLPPSASRPRRRVPRRRRFRLLGASGTAAELRTELLRRGYREGGGRATYVVLAHSLDVMMGQRWARRVRAGSAVRWARMWRFARSHDRVPPGLDIPGLAARLASEVGSERVHIVLDADPALGAGKAAALLGAGKVDVAGRPDPLATDLLRRLNPLLDLDVDPARRALLVERLWPVVALDPSNAWPGVPAGCRDWATEKAHRMAERLERAAAAGDYVVHGDPTVLVPHERADGHIAAADVLAVALETIGRSWTLSVGEENQPWLVR